MISAVSMITTLGTFSFAQMTPPAKQQQVDVAKPATQRGQFQAVKIVNDVKGSKVELFINKSEKGLIVDGKGQAEEDYSTIKGGQKSVSSVRFVITKGFKQVDSGEIELDWITKKGEAIEKEVVSKLKHIDVTAKVWTKTKKGALVFVIKSVK